MLGAGERSLPFSATASRFPCFRLLAGCLLPPVAPRAHPAWPIRANRACSSSRTEGSKESAVGREETEGANSRVRIGVRISCIMGKPSRKSFALI